MIRLPLPLQICTLLLLTVGSLAHADDVTLAWDPPVGAAPAGYILRYGSWPGPVTQFLNTGTTTTVKVTGLEAGTTYEFHVVAYDSAGVTSGPSNFVRATIPGTGLPGPTPPPTPTPDGGGSDSGVPASQPYRMYLAEGAQSSVLDTRLSLANPNSQSATATIFLRPAGGSPAFSRAIAIPPLGHADVSAASMLGGQAASFGVEVASSARIGVSRTLTFDRGIGGHAELATAAPARRWYFAEGATHGRFELFYLLFNPGTTPATVSMTYLLPSGASAPRYHEIAPQSRLTVWVDQEGPALANTELAAVIESISGPPIVAERAMYLTGSHGGFVGGHVSLGATQPRSRWLMAEGATGAYFSTYILLANPHAVDVPVALSFRRPDGLTVQRTVTVPPGSRRTVNIADVDNSLRDTAVWTEVRTPGHLPVIAERVMWWPGRNWQDGHASSGMTQTAARWLAVGSQHGGSLGHVTYLLAANTSATPQTARVTVLGPNGPQATTSIQVPPGSRYTIDMAAAFPSIQGTYSVMVESVGGEGKLVVEQSVYWDAGGLRWAAGTAIPGMPLEQ